MGESRTSRRRLLAVAAAGYAAVFAALSLLHAPAIAVAVYFVIPTALVAIAGGPTAGAAASFLSMGLVLVAERISSRAVDPVTPSLSSSARLVALLFTSLLVGRFAARNRALLAELRLGAERDNLTGLGNHRFYESAVDRRIEANETFALLVCDMDRLKDVNDAEGHAAGDEALRGLATHLRALARPDDDIARIGGDEFCLVARLDGADDANGLAARLEAALGMLGCAATFGWALHPVEGRSKTDLFRIADERLYARKASGGRTLRSVPAAS